MTTQPQTPLPFNHPQPDPRHDERAGAIAMAYVRPRQREFAMHMLARHPRAADYLEQAPVLLLGCAEHARRNLVSSTRAPVPDTPPLNGATHDAALREWRQLVETGWKLPKVMAHYRIAPQWRALRPGAEAEL